MKAVLTTGETVALPRDCTCINHKTPHWVHMWRSSRDWKVAEAKKYAAKMDAIKAAVGETVPFSVFAEYEQLKLALASVAGEIARIYGEAEAEFRRRGIQCLIDEPEDELTDSR